MVIVKTKKWLNLNTITFHLRNRMMYKIFLLLVIFQTKHFLADYPFQTEYMLGKFKKTGWVKPLIAHAGIHALLTFLICICFLHSILLICVITLFDFIVHFSVDRIKASPNMLGRFKSLSAIEYSTATIEQKKQNKYFWWFIGLDQMIHHLTHYIIIAFIIFNL